ncbi:MAG TPA: hypothetical protein VFZ00_34155, partial [Solirubrobacter sp.]|nr:hypothetical protein [Solirubrobacter sp.]
PGPIARTVADAATAFTALSGTEVPLSAGALSGKRVAVIDSTAAPYPAAVAAVTGLGATAVTKTVGTPSPNPPSIVSRSFEHDLNAYLGGVSGGAGSLQGIVNYNTAHPVEGLKYQQRELIAALSPDLSSFEADLTAGKASNAALIDDLLSDTDVIMVPSGHALVGIADRAGYPVLTVPAGYGTGGAGRNPIGVTFVGAAGADAALLAAGYAFEQATNVRLAPSYTNPSMFRCMPGSTFFSPHHCHPGDLLGDVPAGPTEFPVEGDVGGTVPATLSLTLGPAATFGAFTPGVTRTYSASMTATVTSTAGDGALTVTDPSPVATGHLVNGAFSLAQPLQGLGVVKTWSAPVSNDTVTIGFGQTIGETEPLRTGAYAKTLTFTLSTTAP